MKTKVLVLAVFLLGLLALAAAGQTPVISGPKPSKTITIAGSGNQVVILRGTLEAAKAAAMASPANVFVSGRSALAPGQVVFLGQTGSATSTAADMVVVSPRARAAASPLGATIEQQVFPGDLFRATPGPGGLTDQAGGFVIGPNGFPIPVTAAQSTPALAIGPNGFPTLGSPTATVPIDTNGFPAAPGTASTQTSMTTTAGSATTIVVPARARTMTGGAAAPTRGAAGSAATR